METQEQAQETVEPQDSQEAVEPANMVEGENPAAERHAKDAKKQRLKAKALQETNEALTAELENTNTLLLAARQQIADRELTGVLAKPDGFWKLGNDPATYFDEAGNLDGKRLTKDAGEAANTYGLQTVGRGYPAGRIGIPPQPQKTWQSVLKDATN